MGVGVRGINSIVNSRIRSMFTGFSKDTLGRVNPMMRMPGNRIKKAMGITMGMSFQNDDGEI